MTRLRSRWTDSRWDETPVNPMDSVGNLADAMLVLAVGIMLALIINWNVDISAPGETLPAGDPIPVEDGDLDPVEEGASILDGGNLQEMGRVYYDPESGQYYIIENGK